MNLKEIGEFGFIERFKPMFGGLVNENQTGIGDDCAILPANDDEDWLVTTDLLMEDVHFLRDSIQPHDLGYKSLAVNLSDIAAMGGTPLGSFLSIAIPPDIELEYLDDFMNGFHLISQKYDTPLLGGDTTKSLKHLAINVCVIGKCGRNEARRRNMAQVGDSVCVTGYLGDSAGGLQILLNQLGPGLNTDYLLRRHHKPEPRIHEGRFLAGFQAVHAMMDVSDGIASDLNHILKASGVSANIHLDQLPVSSELTEISALQGWRTTELATGGGEDYELLVTISRDELETIQREFLEKFGFPLVQIGTITSGNGPIRWYDKTKEIGFQQTGFDHFQ